MRALLLLNLGTPDSPKVADVRRYLKEFLSDPLVIDIPALARWMLVNLIILPTRPAKSAEAYQKIWTERGSPLRFHTEDLATGVRQVVTSSGGKDLIVDWAMRYGQPGAQERIQNLYAKGVREITVLPLYPQYALSSTETGLAQIREIQKEFSDLKIDWIAPFYAETAFVESQAALARPVLAKFRPDHVLMSYHGLPERQIRKTDFSEAPHCLTTDDCCATLTRGNRNCYRAHCYATSRSLAKSLGLARDQYSVAFQSRLGRTPWIQPFTDQVIPSLAQKGVKKLAVICPSFVADCLETLEEIGIRAKELFLENGGESLELVSCVNASPQWQEGVYELYNNLELRRPLEAKA